MTTATSFRGFLRRDLSAMKSTFLPERFRISLNRAGITETFFLCLVQARFLTTTVWRLKRIFNETKALDGYKDELKPVFRSTSSQFMTTIYSMGYEPKNKQDGQYQDGIKSGLSWEQVGTKIGLGWDEVEKLFIALQEPKTMTELKELYQWSNTTKFRTKYVSPLIEAQFVGMTLPNKPTSPKQRYFLTDNGKALLANATRNSDTSDLVEKVNHMLKKLSEEEKRIALEMLHK